MATWPADIYVAVGSNIAPERNVPEAIRRMSESAESIAVSTFYRTRPIARPEQDDYRNGVVHLRVLLEREEVEQDLLKGIERDLGRVRAEDKHAARTIDLDLAVYCEDGKAIWTGPDVLRRNFIATPLAELAPELQFPNGSTAAEIADALGEEGMIADEGMTRILRELVRHGS